jgi:hypothetical protein
MLQNPRGTIIIQLKMLELQIHSLTKAFFSALRVFFTLGKMEKQNPQSRAAEREFPQHGILSLCGLGLH